MSLGSSTLHREDHELLSAYVPAMARRWLARDPALAVAPRMECFPAVVLLADLSGFTRLTEQLAQRGDRGAEAIQEVLNLCFGQMIETIAAHGGEVSKFAGDAPIALWPVGSDEGLGLAVRRAAACGLAVQQVLHGLAAIEGTRLRVRVGIGAGAAWAACVGGAAGLWESLLGGSPVAQAAAAERQAAPGEVVLSGAAWDLAGDGVSGRPQGDGFLLERMQTATPLPAPAPSPQISGAGLRAFIPPAVLTRLDAGQRELLGEFRQVTAMFVGITEQDGAAPEALERLQPLTRCLQEVVTRFDGSVHQLIVDDKGTALVAAWGVPLHTHEDDAARGALAALAIRADLAALGFAAAIGVATGRVFTGMRGNSLRLEYAMIGAPVNLAARLMQAAGDGVLCDAPTRAAAGGRARFEELEPIEVKGRSGTVQVFRPLGQGRRAGPRQRALAGREEERQALAGELAALEAGERGGLVILEGEAGFGKSLLVTDLLARASESQALSLVAAADSLERSTPYYAFRDVFAQLLAWHGPGDAEARRRELLAALDLRPDLQDRAPLLNPVLPFALEETPLTSAMTAEARSEAARDLMIHLFQQGMGARPVLLVLEDAHWLDTASWGLAEALRRLLSRILMVVATRPVVAEEVGTEQRRLFSDAGARRMALRGLTDEAALALVCSRLEVASLPPAVAKLILGRAEGHPLFLEELAFALRDRGVIRIEQGQCRLATAESDLAALDFPATVQGVVASRIDRLDPAPQLTLKVASVVGRGFDLGTLREIHPIPTDEAELAAQLAALEGTELLERDAGQHAYLFRHAIVQDVAYGMLPFAQRRPLHGAVAHAIERAAGDGPRPYPLLAHHWREAGAAPEALVCFTAAGEQALGNYANSEAIRFFRAALELDPQVAPAARRRALLELQLGKAYVGASDYGQAQPHIQDGLQLLGLPVPATPLRQGSRVLGEILLQTAHRLRPGRFLGRDGHRRDLLLAGAAAYEGLVELCYYTNQPLLSFLSALRTLNLSEAAGSSAELARSYALAGTMAGFVPLHRLADGYCRRAEEIAAQTTDTAALLWVSVVNGVFYTGVGRWDRAEALYGRAIELSRRLGDHRRGSDAVGNLSDVRYFQGRFSDALHLIDELQAAATARNDERYLVAALRSRAITLMALGRDEEAWSCLEEVRRFAASGELAERELTELDLHGLGALVRLRLGDAAGAREAADRALALRERLAAQVSFYSTVVGCAAVAEVYLDLRETAGAGDAGGLRRSAQRACKALWKLARTFPIARPSAWWLQGRLEALSGRQDRARRSWQRCLREARERAMPVYVEQAEQALGRGEGRA